MISNNFLSINFLFILTPTMVVKWLIFSWRLVMTWLFMTILPFMEDLQLSTDLVMGVMSLSLSRCVMHPWCMVSTIRVVAGISPMVVFRRQIKCLNLPLIVLLEH